MKMELVVLGSGGFALGAGRGVRQPPPAGGARPAPSGTAVPCRQPAGYAVRLGAGVIVLDLGFGNLRQMARAGLDPARVTHAFFTHRHPDHVGDLAALLFFFRYERRPRSGAVRLFGPPGFKAFVGRLSAAYRPWLSPRGYRLLVRDLEDGARVAGPGWGVSCGRVPHPTPAFAYRLSSGGRSLVYSGDTGFSLGLAGFSQGCDLLVLECSSSDRQPHPGVHLTVSEALELARLSNCRRAIFSHLGDAAAVQLRGFLPRSGRFRMARDLMRIAM